MNDIDNAVAEALLRCRRMMSPIRSSLPNDRWNIHTRDPEIDNAPPRNYTN